jgi:hypothetical protein
MRSLLLAITAAAAFAIWTANVRADAPPASKAPAMIAGQR